MTTKETNLVTRIFSCFIVFVIVTLFAITAIASSESSPNGGPAVKGTQTSEKGYIWKNTGAERKTAMSQKECQRVVQLSRIPCGF